MARNNKNLNAVPKVMRVEQLESRLLYSADAAPLLALVDPLDDNWDQKHPSEQALWASIDHESDTQFLGTFESTAHNGITEVVIVDSSQPDIADLQALLQSQLEDGDRIAVVTLADTDDPVASIADILSRYSDLQAVHIVSHAADGALHIGNQTISQSTLLEERETIEQWGEALHANGDILLYGCNLSATEDGRLFARTLSTLTDADVASSNDITGHALKNGDWDLEVVEGEVETGVVVSAQVQNDWVDSLDITSNLIHHWEFYYDGADSAGSADAFLINGVGTPTGVVNLAGDFTETSSGSTQYGQVDSTEFTALNTSDFTIALWAKTNVAQNGDVLFGNTGGSNIGYSFYLNGSGQVVFAIGDGTATQTVTSTAAIADGDWRHITARRSGAELQLDVYNLATDNSSATTAPTAYSAIAVGNSYPTRMGTDSGASSSGNYDGLLDEIRIYTRLLSDGDVDLLIGQAVTGAEQVVVNNERPTVPLNGPAIAIDSSILLTTDADTPDSQLVYELTGSSTAGAIVVGGTQLGTGDTFTQQDVNLGNVSILSLGHPVATSAAIFLDVDDGQGSASSVLFRFDIDHTPPPSNTAPTIISDTVISVTEDNTTPVGDTVFNLINPAFSDSDSSDSLVGILVTDAPNVAADGSWHYSTDGTAWHSMGAVSPTNALVLSSTTLIDFLPATNFTGTPGALQFRVLDSTYVGPNNPINFTDGATREVVSASPSGGTTAISATTGSVNVAIQPVNDSPTLSNSVMPSMDEDTTPALTTIQSIFGPQFSDPDVGDTLLGIAVSSNTTTGAVGEWQYSNDGLTWEPIGTVSSANALVLSQSDYLRYVPENNYFGPAPTLSVHAIDNTYAGNFSQPGAPVTLDASVINSTNPVSQSPADVDITVNSVNDPPYNLDSSQAALRVDEDATTGTSLGYMSVDDVDSTNLTFSIFNSANAGGRIEVNPTTGEVTVKAGASLDYETNTFHQITVVASDGEVDLGTVQGNFPIHVRDVNDAPTLTSPMLITVLEDDTNPAGEVIADVLATSFDDVDAGDGLHAIAITDNSSTNGDWQYKVAGGSWTSVGSIPTGDALLISATDELRFVPATDYVGAVTPLTIFALDTTYSGALTTTTAPAYVDLATTLNGTFLSETDAYIDVLIQPVNDPAIITLGNVISALPEDTSTAAAIDVADILVADVDGGTNNVSLSGLHAGLFQITGNVLQLKPGVSLDTETLSLLQVDVNVDDTGVPGTPDDSTSYSLQITNVNEAPTFNVMGAVSTMAEGATGTVFGTVAASDVDSPAPTIFVVNAPGSTTASPYVILNGNSLEQNPAATFDFETMSSFSYTVYVEDNQGLRSPEQTFTVLLTNTNEAPTFSVNNPVTSINENVTGVVFGSVTRADVDSPTPNIVVTYAPGSVQASPHVIFDGTNLIQNPAITYDYETDPSFSYTVHAIDDQGLVSAEQTFTVTVNDVDEPPVLSAIEAGVLTYIENGAAVSISSTLVVTEPDNSDITGAIVEFSTGYVAGEDDLTFADQNGITGLWNSSQGILYLTGAASAADYQAALQSVAYSNLSNNPAAATRTIDIQVSDGSNSSNVETRVIAVTATNNAPAVQLNPLVTSLNENTVVSSALDVADIVVTDSDGGTNTLSLSGSDASLFQIAGNKLQLLPGIALDAETLAQLDVTINVDDATIGAGIDDSDSYTLLIDDVDEPPVLSAIEAGVLTYIENGAAVPISSTLMVTEPDNSDISGAIVQFSTGYVAGADELTFLDQNGITGFWNPSQGILYLSGAASAADYQAAIQSVAYSNLSNNPAAATRTIDIQVSDGPNSSNVETRVIAVTATNNAPAVQSIPLVTSLDENTVVSSALDVANIVIADPDGGTNTLSLSGPDASLFQIAGNKLQLLPGIALDAETLAQLDVTINVDDATIGAGIEDSDNYTLLINNIDEPPVLSAIEPGVLTYVENGAPVPISSTLTVAEPDDGLVFSAVVQFTTGFVAGEDQLSFTPQNNITGSYNANTGLLLISGQATAADYQAALQSVTYSNLSNNSTVPLRTIEILVAEPNLTSGFVSRDIVVTATNDAPTVQLNPLVTSLDENTVVSAALDVANIVVADMDGGTNTLSLSGTHASLFQITGNKLQLQPGVVPDAETLAQLDVTINVDDATIGAGVDDSDNYTFLVDNIDEPPVLSAIEPGVLTYVENGAPVAISTSVQVAEPDNGLIVGATVQFTTGSAAGVDQLSFVTQNGITGSYNAIIGLLSLTGPASAADYQAAIQSVTYSNTSNNPAAATRTIDIQVTDGVNVSNIESRVIAVTSTNNAPAVQLNPLVASLDENTVVSSALDVADILVTDPDGGTNTLSLSGTHANLFQITGNKLQLQPGVVPDAETLAQLDVTINVDDATIGAGVDDSDNYTLLVDNVDEPPVLSTIEAGVLTYVENGAPVAISTSVQVAEPDNGLIDGATVQFTTGFVAGADQLAFATQNGITGSYNAITGLLSLTGQASAADYQAAIQSVTYSNTSNNPAAATRAIDIQVTDGVNVSNIESRAITVTATNDAPTVQLNPLVASLDENTVVSSALDVANIVVTDIDGGTNTLSLSGTHANLFQITGNKLQLQPGVVPDAETLAQLDVTINVDDATIGAGVDDSDNYTLLVDNVDEPPVLSTIEAGVLTYVENGAPVAISTSVQVAEPDNGLINGATVQFTTGFVAGADQLAFATQNGITGSYNAITGLLSLTGQASAADYQAAIQSVTYSNTSNNPAAATRAIDIQVTDGVNVSNIESRAITVTATNDAPTVQLNPLVASLDENTVVSSALDVANIVVTDIDGGTNTLSLSGTHASLFQITGNKLQLQPGIVPDAETLAQLDVTINVDDATIGAGVDDSDNYTLLVDNVDEPPVLSTIEAGVLTYVENGAPVAISASVQVAEPDNGLIDGATVQFTTGFVAGADQLAFATQNGITGSYNAITGLLSLTGQASAADYQAAIQSVTYSNTSNNPAAATRAIDIQVTDGVNVSNIESRAITVTATNDAPTVQLNPLVASLDENTVVSSALDVANIVVTDIDGGTNTLSLSGMHASLFQIAGNKLQLQPGVVPDADTLAQLDVSINVDDATIGAGIDDSDNYALQIDDVNEPPVLSALESGALSYTENGLPVAVSSTVIVAEPDNGQITGAQIQLVGYSAGDDLLSFTSQNGITAQFDVVTGVLNLTGQASAADYQNAIRSVGYSNGSDAPSNSQRTIELTVSDGVNNSNTLYRPVVVVPVADAPTVSLTNIVSSIPENTPTSAPITVANISVVDPDGGSNTLSLTGADANLFQISANQLQLKPGVVLNAESLSQLSVAINVDDATIGTGVDDSINYSLLISDTNEAPVLSMIEPIAAAYIEDGAPIAVSSTIEVSEPDNGLISSAQIAIVSGFDQNTDQLNFSNQNGISGSYNSASGVLTMTGVASATQYQSAIQSVSYAYDGDNPMSSRDVQISVNDGVNESNVVTRVVDLVAVNDEEELYRNEIVEVEANETLVLSNAMLEVRDADQTASQLVYTLGGSSQNMLLMVSGVPATSFTQADVNLGLVSMDISGVEPGSHGIPFTVDDGTGSVTAFNFSITVNDQPVPEVGAATPEPISSIPDLVLSVEPTTDWSELLSIETIGQNATTDSSTGTDSLDTSDSESPLVDSQVSTSDELSVEESNTAIPSLGEASLSSLNIPDFASATARMASLAVYDNSIAQSNISQSKLVLSEQQMAELQVTSLLSLEPLSVTDSNVYQAQSENVGFLKSLEKMQQELALATEKIEGKAVARDTVVGFSLSVTAGFLIWMLRGGALLASMFSIAPLWKQLDPLPILSNTADDEQAGAADDKVETLFREGGSR